MRRSRRQESGAADLTETLERLAVKIGDDVGRKIARALVQPAPRGVARICATEGCERAVVAKGLCKSHYNLMLYHRRKQAGGEARGRTAGARRTRRGE
ncbi:MAG TPA: hypothetical protein VN033_10140 [Vulgatibacter sp.]|nr:hypothetical protein [Vulgatibacter sp.]